MTDFAPPRLEHVVIDEQQQMQKYLADIAMEDLLLATGKRTERPNGLMAKYKNSVAAQHASEETGGSANPMAEEIDIGATIGLGGGLVKVPAVVDFEG